MGKRGYKTRVYLVTPTGKLRRVRPLLMSLLGLGLIGITFLLSEQYFQYNRLLIDREKTCRSQLFRIEASRIKLESGMVFCEQKKKQICSLLYFTTDYGKKTDDPQ